jgi:heterodisulfide reductase subunit D
MALQDYRHDCAYCTRCSVCKWVPFYQLKRVESRYICPAVTKYGFHAYSGGGKLNVAFSLLEKHIEMSPAVADVAYKCNLCGACDYTSKLYNKDYDVAEVIEELRAACVEAGQTIPEHKDLIAGMKNEGNCVGKTAAERLDWTVGAPVKKLSEGAQGEVFYYAGCENSFEQAAVDRTKAVLALLAKAGVDLVAAGVQERCSGSEALQLGYRGEGKAAAEALARQVRASGAKLIVTPSAHSYAAFRYYYPRNGVDLGLPVIHVTELLDQLVTDGTISLVKPVPLKVTYHDPCNLGRRSEPFIPLWTGPKKDRPLSRVRTGEKGVYEPPRRLLRAIPGLTLIEMDRIRAYAWCCGGGAGVREAFPGLTELAGSERIKEAGFSGADTLVSACARCESVLAAAARAAGGDLQVQDVVDLVLMSAGDAR